VEEDAGRARDAEAGEAVGVEGRPCEELKEAPLLFGVPAEPLPGADAILNPAHPDAIVNAAPALDHGLRPVSLFQPTLLLLLLVLHSALLLLRTLLLLLQPNLTVRMAICAHCPLTVRMSVPAHCPHAERDCPCGQ
jgi:hypothetical protein